MGDKIPICSLTTHNEDEAIKYIYKLRYLDNTKQEITIIVNKDINTSVIYIDYQCLDGKGRFIYLNINSNDILMILLPDNVVIPDYNNKTINEFLDMIEWLLGNCEFIM